MRRLRTRHRGDLFESKVFGYIQRLDQIAGKNVKGAFFSTASFQKSALQYSRAKGIAFVRMLPGNKVQWILRRTPTAIPVERRTEYSENQVIEALTTPEYTGQSEFLFGYVRDV